MKLTDEMRQWLGIQHGDALLYDIVLRFCNAFSVTALGEVSMALYVWLS